MENGIIIIHTCTNLLKFVKNNRKVDALNNNLHFHTRGRSVATESTFSKICEEKVNLKHET